MAGKKKNVAIHDQNIAFFFISYRDQTCMKLFNHVAQS